MELSLAKKPSIHKLQLKNLSVVFNPAGAEKADVLLFSEKQDKLSSTDDQKIFDGAGEYEVNDTMLRGVRLNGTTSYAIEGNGLRLVQLSEIEIKLNDKQVEQLTPIDILLIPAAEGKSETITAMISTLEPRIIVPVGADEAMIKKIAAELGVTAEKTAKFKISHKDLPEDSHRLIVIE